MPEGKIRSKATLSKEKAKRKRVDTEAPSLDKSAVSKPAKKLRKDDSRSVTRTNTSGRQRSEPDVMKSVVLEGADASEKALMSLGNKKSNKGKSAQTDDDGAQKASDKQLQIAHADVGPSDEEGSEYDGLSPREAEEEEIHLQGFSSESDSSDEELDDMDASPLDVSALPSIPNDDAAVRRNLEKAKKNPVSQKLRLLACTLTLVSGQTEDRGVIYLGRIPHGFYEDQMRNYFSQFGDITRLRLSRNKKVCIWVELLGID